MLYVNGQKTVEAQATKKEDFEKIPAEAITIIRTIKQQFTLYLKNNDWKPVSKVPQKNGPVYKNLKLWDALPVGTEFVMLDIKHAYWRVAYLQGYISKRIYDKYLEDDKLKLWRNVGMACVVAKQKREYYQKGRLVSTVQTWNDPYEQIYRNIRHITYNTVGDIKRKYPDSVIAHRTDAVLFLPELEESIKKILWNRKYKIRTLECVKTGEKEFTANGEPKKL